MRAVFVAGGSFFLEIGRFDVSLLTSKALVMYFFDPPFARRIAVTKHRESENCIQLAVIASSQYTGRSGHVVAIAMCVNDDETICKSVYILRHL